MCQSCRCWPEEFPSISCSQGNITTTSGGSASLPPAYLSRVVPLASLSSSLQVIWLLSESLISSNILPSVMYCKFWSNCFISFFLKLLSCSMSAHCCLYLPTQIHKNLLHLLLSLLRQFFHLKYFYIRAGGRGEVSRFSHSCSLVDGSVFGTPKGPS